MKPVLLKEFLKPWRFVDIKKYVDDIAAACAELPMDDQLFQRHTAHNDRIMEALHKKLEPSLSKMLGLKVKPSYSLISMYGEEGICYLHTDRPPCRYTIDLCVSQKEPWPIIVDDVEYILNENDAIIYSGTHSPHYRNKIQKGNHCSMVFFHFVDESYAGPLG